YNLCIGIVNSGGWNGEYVPYFPKFLPQADAEPSTTVTVQAGRWDINNGVFTTAPGIVTAVNFYAVTRQDFVNADSLGGVNFFSIGTGTFNDSTGFWEVLW